MIGQTPAPWIENPWFVVAMALAFVTLVGLAWAIIRERHLVDLSDDQTRSLRDVERTFSDVSHDLKALVRQVERSEELSESHRQEMIRLVVDVERRITDAMRYTSTLGAMPGHPATHVNFHGGATGTQIGDGNHQR